MSIEIRKLGKEDRDRFIELCCGLTAYNKAQVWVDEDFTEIIKKRRLKVEKLLDNMKSNQMIFIAIEDQQPVGYIIGYVFQGMRTNGYIDELYIQDDARGKGIGSQLMSTAIDWIKHRGAKRITLNVFNWNDSAIKFYESHNFKPYATSYECYLP